MRPIVIIDIPNTPGKATFAVDEIDARIRQVLPGHVTLRRKMAGYILDTDHGPADFVSDRMKSDHERFVYLFDPKTDIDGLREAFRHACPEGVGHMVTFLGDPQAGKAGAEFTEELKPKPRPSLAIPLDETQHLVIEYTPEGGVRVSRHRSDLLGTVEVAIMAFSSPEKFAATIWPKDDDADDAPPSKD